MAKSLATYWNVLAPENAGRWTPIRGLEGMAEELTLSIDPVTGEYTRLTRFHPGADTTRQPRPAQAGALTQAPQQRRRLHLPQPRPRQAALLDVLVGRQRER